MHSVGKPNRQTAEAAATRTLCKKATHHLLPGPQTEGRAQRGHGFSTLSHETYAAYLYLSVLTHHVCRLQIDNRDPRKAKLLSTLVGKKDSFDVFLHATQPAPTTVCPAIFATI